MENMKNKMSLLEKWMSGYKPKDQAEAVKIVHQFKEREVGGENIYATFFDRILKGMELREDRFVVDPSDYETDPQLSYEACCSIDDYLVFMQGTMSTIFPTRFSDSTKFEAAKRMGLDPKFKDKNYSQLTEEEREKVKVFLSKKWEQYHEMSSVLNPCKETGQNLAELLELHSNERYLVLADSWPNYGRYFFVLAEDEEVIEHFRKQRDERRAEED